MIPRLHVVTDDNILSKPDFVSTAVEMLSVLQRRLALHIRGHQTPTAQLYAIAETLAKKALRMEALLVVNDRVDVALAAGAAAVQLGKRSLPVESVRTIASHLRIGYSAHDVDEAGAAERSGADFVFAGTIFPSASHPNTEPAGVALLNTVVTACSVPVFAIGGVTLERVPDVERTGAHGVAVIRAVWDAPDPVQAAENFAKMLY